MPDNASTLSDRTIEMINLVIDGEATPREREEVQTLLSSSPEARRFYESMQELSQALDSMPLAAAPGVKHEVLAGIRPRAAVASAPSRSPFAARRRVVVGLAWAAAAALVLVVAVDRLPLSGPRVDAGQAAASMPPRDVAAWPVLSRVESESATLTIRKSGERYALQLTNGPAGRVTIRWDEEKLIFRSGAPESVLILDRRAGAAGSAAVTVLLEDKPILQTYIDLKR